MLAVVFVMVPGKVMKQSRTGPFPKVAVKGAKDAFLQIKGMLQIPYQRFVPEKQVPIRVEPRMTSAYLSRLACNMNAQL